MSSPAPSLASDPGASVDALLRLAADFPAQVAQNPRILQHPKALARVELFAGLALASCPEAPAALLERLASNERSELRATVAQNRACPALLLERLALDADAEVRATALDNPALDAASAASLRLLADDPAQRARAHSALLRGDYQAAASIDAPAELLRLLSRRPALRAVVFANRSCPADLCEDMLNEWLEKGAPVGQFDLARLPYLSEEAQRRLASPPAFGPAMAAQLFQRADLIADLIPHVLSTLLARDQPAPASLYLDPTALARVLRSYQAPEATLVAIFHKRIQLRPTHWNRAPQSMLLALLDAVLAQPACSRAVLRKMASHSMSLVRAEAARQRALPRATLLALLGDPSHLVRRAAWANPKLPEAWRQRLVRLGFPPGLAVCPGRAPELTDEDRAELAETGPWLRSLAR